MANIHTCPTSISKTMESIKDGTNRIGPMQVSEPVRTQNMEKNVAAGMAEQRAREKAYDRTLWVTKSNFFNNYEQFLEATAQLEDN